jgi:starch synthase (maltosyl-transferring)
LSQGGALEFHRTDNDQVICYSRASDDLWDILVVVVNLHSWHTNSAWVELPLERFHVPPNLPYEMHDLLTDARYRWQGHWNYVQLNPHTCPVHVLKLRRHVRSEYGVDYFQ